MPTSGHVTLINPFLGMLQFDAVVRVGFDRTARVTQHPVEDGTTVTDHVQANPTPIVIEGVVSRSPWSSSPNALKLNPPQDAVDFLEGSIGQPLTVVSTIDGTYTNMVIQRYAHDTTKVTGKRFTIDLLEIIIAVTGVSLVPATAPSGFQGAADVGSQAMTEVDVDSSSLAQRAQSTLDALKSVYSGGA